MSNRFERYQNSSQKFTELSKPKKVIGGLFLLGAAVFGREVPQNVDAKIPTNTIVNPDFAKRLGGKEAYHWSSKGDVRYQGNLIEGEYLVGLRYSEQFGLKQYGDVSTRVLLESKNHALELVVSFVKEPTLSNEEVIFPSFSIRFFKFANQRGGRVEEVGNFYYKYPAYEGLNFEEQTVVVFKTDKNGRGKLIDGQEFMIPKDAHLMEISLNADGGFTDPEHDGNHEGRHFGIVRFTFAQVTSAK